MKNEIKCFAGWVRASLWLHPKQIFAVNITLGPPLAQMQSWRLHLWELILRASKAWECSTTLRRTPALAHWESSGTVLCSALVSSQSCFMGSMLGELAGHRKALVIACRCSVQTTLATDGRYGVEVRASACQREAEHLQAFLACHGVITKMNAQACYANGGHTQYWRGTLLFVV